MSVETDSNPGNPNGGSGYVSSNPRDTRVPMLGHMVTYRFMEKQNTSFTVDYETMVEKAKELGLTRSFVPVPRYGINAFRWARRTFITSEHWTTVPMSHSINWDNQRCRAQYKCVKILQDYVIQRVEKGRVNGNEHVHTENLYRLKYVAGRGDVMARAWAKAYVKRAWEGEESLSEAELSILTDVDEDGNIKDGSQNIVLEAYEEGNVHDLSYFAQAYEAVVARYKSEITSVSNRIWRAKVRELLLDRFNAIPFTAIRGAHVVPDTRSEAEALDDNGVRQPAPYLDELDAINTLIRWFGGEAEEQSVTEVQSEQIPGVEPEEEESTPEKSLEERLQELHRARCQMTILGYIDDDAQRQDLQRAMTMEVNRRMDAYYKQVENAFNTMNDEDQASIDRQLKRLKKMKAKAAKMLEFYCGGNYMDGVNVNPDIQQPRMSGIATRIAHLGSAGVNMHNLRALVNFDESDSSQDEEQPDQ